MTSGWIGAAAIAVIVAWIIWAYNRFVRLTNRCEEAWSDINVQLKRRYDLIPNLVETLTKWASGDAKTVTR